MLTKDDKLNLTLAGFQSLEAQMLACMDFIPFIEKNKSAVSPKFVTIILEACSLIDSTFREAAEPSSGHLTMRDYARGLENHFELEEAISLGITTPLAFLRPFKNWTTKAPAWWMSYNQLKHDRLNNFSLASYETAFSALAALHQVMARSLDFFGVLTAAGWFNSASVAFVEMVAARIGSSGRSAGLLPAESRLFVSPVTENFVQWDERRPSIIDDCEFSDRIKSIITVHEWL
jgi:hypothetical protein